MKKKTRGKNFEVIESFLKQNGKHSAADIQRATKIKGNIYVILGSMVKKGVIKKMGKMYGPVLSKPETITISASTSKPLPTDSRVKILEQEIVRLDFGIEQLRITKNYLHLRIKEIQREQIQ